MKTKSPVPSKQAGATLVALGTRLRAHREALDLTATTVAEVAGISRVTLHRIERGQPSVAIGAYVSALAAVGLALDLRDVARPHKDRTKSPLPTRIRLADHPQLRRIAWQLGDVATLTPKEALALYERNWKHIDADALDDAERRLIQTLADALGGGRLLV